MLGLCECSGQSAGDAGEVTGEDDDVIVYVEMMKHRHDQHGPDSGDEGEDHGEVGVPVHLPLKHSLGQAVKVEKIENEK